MGLISWFDAVAEGLKKYQWVRNGRPDGALWDDPYADEVKPIRKGVVNPFTSQRVAKSMERSVVGLLPAMYGAINMGSQSSLILVRDAIRGHINTWRGEEDYEPMVRAYLFEVARTAHGWFSQDTDPDLTYLTDVNMTFATANGDETALGAEIRAFLETSFSGDLAGACGLPLDILRDRAETAFPSSDASLTNKQCYILEIFAAYLVVELAGVYGTQVAPDVMDVKGRPIAATLFEEDGDDDD